MDGIANVARQQQQSQVSSGESHLKVAEEVAQQVQAPKQENIIQKIQEESANTSTKINSKEQVEDLVKQLNEALAPMTTNIKFGVDSQDIFYVSVIESATSKMLRRFPAEQAIDFLPKMQEVTGILFDTKG
ncbi:MAG: flagellar biosynthesis protein FlaG [Sulfurimonas sp.]|nr:MAG: flagellar biosynthesis protein FlaG [Sulfurimonas sp.]